MVKQSIETFIERVSKESLPHERKDVNDCINSSLNTSLREGKATIQPYYWSDELYLKIELEIGRTPLFDDRTFLQRIYQKAYPKSNFTEIYGHTYLNELRGGQLPLAYLFRLRASKTATLFQKQTKEKPLGALFFEDLEFQYVQEKNTGPRTEVSGSLIYRQALKRTLKN